MSADDNEEQQRSARVQLLTCPCCSITHPDVPTLKAHLVAMQRRIDLKLEQLKPKVAA